MAEPEEETSQPVARTSSRGSFSRKNRQTFPWLPLVLLLISIYFFWILPRQLAPRPVKVIFEKTPPAPAQPAKSSASASSGTVTPKAENKPPMAGSPVPLSHP